MSDAESESRAIEELAERLGARAAAATNPLFELDQHGRRTCVASCVLIRIGPSIAVATASHALVPGRSYQFGANTEILDLAGRTRRALADSAEPDAHDWIDLAVVLLDPQIAQRVDPQLAIAPGEVDTLNRPVDVPVYLTIGYPYTKQKPHRRSGENAATAHRILLTRRPLTDYCELGIDPIANLLLQFDRKNTFRRGVPATSPDPHGMSGGSVWLLPGFAQGAPDAPKLAGFVTAWHKAQRKRLIATRAHLALTLLLQLEPTLGAHMPPLQFGSAT